MDILSEIVANKRKEVEASKELYPVKLLEKSMYFDGKPVSLKKYLQREDKSGIIAEIKRKSPSKGMINAHVSVERTSIGYMQAGASGLSVLTDKDYFGGSPEDLKVARSFNFCPILRKDFMIDEYQVIEAKSLGADVILLIAAVLDKKEIEKLGKLAQGLGMEVLLEVHNEEELERSITDKVDLIGVNNRNLKTFETDVKTSMDLVEKIPADFVKVSESGLADPEIIKELKKEGFEGFLMGETFMKNGRPEKAAKEFIKQLEIE
ncbi:indole-3-glycerol phosphate synthase [Ekhidna lutea]|uniref:Indole-3-glycerol phosphate synthase n=1 Tax=Ekhidna lutea TaxID=447679 RepID=A0A239M2Y4_EKHLU|nr:indole-3-glycerol phosphate synthase TrpC [Ekhidna lutea]SNT36488.1 indole-3-glycerol phosphate synthase [Ekhidna lutea]